jgi:hypothetical protein
MDVESLGHRLFFQRLVHISIDILHMPRYLFRVVPSVLIFHQQRSVGNYLLHLSHAFSPTLINHLISLPSLGQPSLPLPRRRRKLRTQPPTTLNLHLLISIFQLLQLILFTLRPPMQHHLDHISSLPPPF